MEEITSYCFTIPQRVCTICAGNRSTEWIDERGSFWHCVDCGHDEDILPPKGAPRPPSSPR